MSGVKQFALSLVLCEFYLYLASALNLKVSTSTAGRTNAVASAHDCKGGGRGFDLRGRNQGLKITGK